MSKNLFNLLKKVVKPQAINRLELISLHIPKTAGTSFRNTLCEVYGTEEVVRLDIELESGETKVREQIYTSGQLPSETKVIHGHFSWPLLDNRFSIDPNIPRITWLRDPVERVISNYYYLSKRLAEELEEEKKGINILKKMQRSLEEYARFEPNRNRMSKFLAGKNLEDFFFIGIVENYEVDLKVLAKRLAWPKQPVFHYNATGNRKPIVPEDIQELIGSLNHEDITIYNKALELRGQGKWGL